MAPEKRDDEIEIGGETDIRLPGDETSVGEGPGEATVAEPGEATQAEAIVGDVSEGGSGETTVAPAAGSETTVGGTGADTVAATAVEAPPASAAAPRRPAEGPLVFDWRREEAFIALGSEEYKLLRLSRLALASLVLGVISCFGGAFFAAWPSPAFAALGIPAVFTGALAVDGIRRHSYVLTGRVVAYGGILLGLLSTLLTILRALLHRREWLPF